MNFLKNVLNSFLQLVCFVVLLGFSNTSYGQVLSDSLKKAIEKKNDTEKIEFLNNLAEKNCKIFPAKSIDYANLSLEISRKIKNRNGELNSLLILGKALKASGKYSESINYIRKASDIYLAANLKDGIAYCYSETGAIYKDLNQFNNALDDLTKALKLYQELNDNKNSNLILNNIGNIYFKTQDFQKAIEYYKKMLESVEHSGNNKEITILFNQIGASYANWGNYEEALKYLEKAKKIAEANNFTQLFSSISKNINDIQNNIANTEKVKTNFDKEKIVKQDQYVSSLETENLVVKNANLKSLDEIEKLSFENQAKELKLHIIQDRYDRQILVNKMKEQSIKILDVKNKLTQAELSKEQGKLKNQRKIIFIILIAFCIVSVLFVFIFRLFLYKKKALILLKEQHEEILQQKEEILSQAEKLAAVNVQILDSIQYAKLIQNSILPDKDYIKYYLNDYFIFFQPKDIVSGDFYWFTHINGKSFIAAIDCTGHGVPGAFMSMIGNTLLNNIVKEKGITYPSEILNNLHLGIVEALKGDNEDLESGMDMSLCVIDAEKKILEFAGAMNGIYIVKEKKIEIIEGNDNSIGSKWIRNEDRNTWFTTKRINIEKEQNIYMFSDGYRDQFGGIDDNKFNHSRFESLLADISNLQMSEQQKEIEKTFLDWKGSHRQIDDVLIIGIKFN